MPVAGYRSLIRRGGFPTSTVSEPFTLVSGTRFQITDNAKRVIDPTLPWHLSHTSGTVPYSNITAFDFLFGEATVTGVSGTLRFTGSFVPLTTGAEIVAEVTAHSLSESSDLIDTTVYTGPSGSRLRKRIYGLGDANISVDLNLNTTDMPTLATLNFNGSRVLFELSSPASAVFRGWGRLASLERTGSVEGKVEASLSWELDAHRDAATGFIAGYNERNIVST